MHPIVYVSAAVLENSEGKILLVQRPAHKPMPFLWEFPGGKLESHEPPEATVIRELWEELGLSIKPQDVTPLTFVSHTYDSFHLIMFVFHSYAWEGEVTLKENQDNFDWVHPNHLDQYPMPEADLPILALLKEKCASSDNLIID